MRHTPCSLVISILLLACGGAPGSSDAGDSGVDGTGPVGLMVIPPDIPWLDIGTPPIAEPLLTPCPAGWFEVVSEDGPVRCHPYDGEPDVCPEGSAHFVGDGACTPVGAPCPVGDFPEGLPTDVEVLYVLSSAPSGGDGTEGSPLLTITDAMNIVASPGTVIAIGKGTYDEGVRVGPGITLWGACAKETRVTASSPSRFAQAVLMVPSADVRLKNLRLGPANLPGMGVYGTRASASIDGLLIEGTRGHGIFVINDAHLDGRELSISGIRADATGSLGRGLELQSRGTALVTRALLSGNRDIGVFVLGAEASVALSDALFAGNRDARVFAADDGTSVTLSDVVVEDTQAQESDGIGGWGLAVQFSATVEVSRALFSRNHDRGVFVNTDGALTLSDVIVEDTEGQMRDGTEGFGLGVQGGAAAEVTRPLFSRNREVGVLALNPGTLARLSDAAVRQTDEQTCAGTTCPDRSLGVALAGIFDASLVATRFEALDSALCGVLVAEHGQVDLSLGQVSGSPIGVCLQVDDYAIERLTERVRHLNNGINLDATSLPFPSRRARSKAPSSHEGVRSPRRGA